MGIDSPDDVDLEVMAFFCGARVKYRDLTSCAARIVGKDNRAIITVDRRTSFERQRFSIAHELGHWVQDRGQAGTLLEVGPAALDVGRDPVDAGVRQDPAGPGHDLDRLDQIGADQGHVRIQFKLPA